MSLKKYDSEVVNISLYLAELTLYDYSLLEHRPSLIAVSCIQAALIIKSNYDEFLSLDCTNDSKLIEFADCKEIEIIEVADKILKLAKSPDA